MPKKYDSEAEQQAMIQHAEKAAGLPSATLNALLSTDDHEDLACGRMTEQELTWFAASVAARWRSGALLPDEKRLFARRHAPGRSLDRKRPRSD